MGLKLAHIRRNYKKSKLSEENIPEEPFSLFEKWFEESVISNEVEPNAVVLSTVSENKPSARVVLLKEVSDDSFVFFTNYQSRKGKEMEVNPFVALTFFWPLSERQVRVEGFVKKTDSEVSSKYFNSRPEESRIGSVVSPQSQVIISKKMLEDEFFSLLNGNLPVVCPPHWGGYRCIPQTIEFWQGGEHRLHDRIRYTKENGVWKTERLAP
jgi:pyridoxamine 5'-phosphate oxidase